LAQVGTGNLTAERVIGLTSQLIPDLTFQEAFELTGRHVNVSIAAAEKHQTSRLMNAFTSPNVYIREALMASSAVPGFFPPVALAAKNVNGERQPYLPSRRWVDGSVSDDLPTKRLARLYGVNHFVVSQVNPFVLPFVRDTTGGQGLISEIIDMTQHTVTGLINTGARIWYKPLSKLPWLESSITILTSVMSQKYTGDINIIPDTRLHNPLKLLKLRESKEAQEMIDMGEKSTWPKIEMIRCNSRVSRALYRIIGEYP
jgi:TAG lipase/steryl ester hydrolase/phospholipase A2/LPA acyltransferase